VLSISVFTSFALLYIQLIITEITGFPDSAELHVVDRCTVCGATHGYVEAEDHQRRQVSARIDGILAAIGDQLTVEESRRLILKKLYDSTHQELNRYPNAEKRGLVQVVENLQDTYAVSSSELESERSETLKTLDGFLKGLGYMGHKV